MPPSPIVKIVINEGTYARVLIELGIPRPIVTMKAGRYDGRPIAGLAMWPNRINLYTERDYVEAWGIRHASNELTKVLLHETRHIWQYATGFKLDGDEVEYSIRSQEVDARAFEERLVDFRGLVTPRRHFPSTSIGRLAKTERAVRQSM